MKMSIARDLMHRDVLCANREWSAEQLAEFLDSEGIHGAPVVDQQGRLAGIVSRTDLARSFAEEALEAPLRPVDPDAMEPSELAPLDELTSVTVAEIMTAEVVTAGETASAGKLAELMQRHSVHRVVIVDEGVVCGIVSITDLLPVVANYERGLAARRTPARNKGRPVLGGAAPKPSSA
jgi:CBS-domain-containing membrane protein